MTVGLTGELHRCKIIHHSLASAAATVCHMAKQPLTPEGGASEKLFTRLPRGEIARIDQAANQAARHDPQRVRPSCPLAGRLRRGPGGDCLSELKPSSSRH